MIGDGWDIGVGVGVKVQACLSEIAATLDDMEGVGYDTRLHECLAVRIEVQSPRIAGAVREYFEDVLGGMIAPDSCIERNAVLIGRAGLADARMGEDAVTAVQPAVRSPAEGVQRFVGVLPVPAVQQDLRLAGRLVFPWLDRHEHKIRSRPDPDAAKTDLQPADEVQSLHEDGAFVELAVAVAVLEDEDT